MSKWGSNTLFDLIDEDKVAIKEERIKENEEQVNNIIKTQEDASVMSGTLTKVCWQSPDSNNHWVIALATDKSGEEFCVKGTLFDVKIGFQYKFMDGEWKTWKDQRSWNFKRYEVALPTTDGGIEAYLISKCNGIGPVIADLITEAFGSEAITILKNNPQLVANKIKGVSTKKANEFQQMLLANEVNQELEVQLRQLLLDIRGGNRYFIKIVNTYEDKAMEKIKENPYRLIDEIDGIGFETADKIAGRLGVPSDDENRINAGLSYCLTKNTFRGNTCMLPDELVIEAMKLLRLSGAVVRGVMDKMKAHKVLIEFNGFIYSKKAYQAEKYIAEKLITLNEYKMKCNGRADYSQLTDDQKNAVDMALNNNVFVLTGAPGVGKTYTIKRIIDSFDDSVTVALAAPTGKAAKRMMEMTDRLAQTMHKLLEPQPSNTGGFYFTRDAKNPIDAKVIILDEVSMVDIFLMSSFLEAVAPTTKLIMVGDHYQLPSVGAGNVLKDMMLSNVIPNLELTQIMRQNEGLIVRNCHSIKNAEKDIEYSNDGSHDFVFIEHNSEEAIVQTVFNMIKNPDIIRQYLGVVKDYPLDILRDVQILSPLRDKTSISCLGFNLVYRDEINKKPAVQYDNDVYEFKVGDKVIQTKNEYTLNIINGDIGFVKLIDVPEKTIVVDFENPDRTVSISMAENNLELAYAITCHKFQGSESPVIIMPIHSCLGKFIVQRNWLYTAISRAKQLCILVGQRSEIPEIIERNHQETRNSNLDVFLQGRLI